MALLQRQLRRCQPGKSDVRCIENFYFAHGGCKICLIILLPLATKDASIRDRELRGRYTRLCSLITGRIVRAFLASGVPSAIKRGRKLGGGFLIGQGLSLWQVMVLDASSLRDSLAFFEDSEYQASSQLLRFLRQCFPCSNRACNIYPPKGYP